MRQAPEMLTRTGYGKGVDWWALGALCFEMVSGRPPFQARAQKDLDRKIMSEKFSAPPYLQANTHSLLKGLLEKDMCVATAFSSHAASYLLLLLLLLLLSGTNGSGRPRAPCSA